MDFFPNILNYTQDENCVTIDFFLQADIIYFKGHFPDSPVLPGVVQIHWAVHFAKKFFNIAGHVKNSPSIKFMNILSEKQKVTLKIEKSEDHSYISFIYFDDSQIYSKGCLYYHGD